MSKAIPRTVDRIVDSARLMVQQRGFHAFSFRDIAGVIGLKTASIHYHFPTKTDLAQAVLGRVRDEFERALAEIDQRVDAPDEKLRRFAAIFLATFGDGDRLCPFCMVATAQEAIPECVRAQVQAFWTRAEAWLVDVLVTGSKQDLFAATGSPETVARAFMAGIEGAMITARAFEDPSRMASTIDYLLAGVMAPEHSVGSVVDGA